MVGAMPVSIEDCKYPLESFLLQESIPGGIHDLKGLGAIPRNNHDVSRRDPVLLADVIEIQGLGFPTFGHDENPVIRGAIAPLPRQRAGLPFAGVIIARHRASRQSACRGEWERRHIAR